MEVIYVNEVLTGPAAESEWSFQAYCYNKLSENFRLVMSTFQFLDDRMHAFDFTILILKNTNFS